MLQTIPRWKVQVIFVDSAENVTLWIHEPHLANVLRQVASMQFHQDAYISPLQIIIGPRED